MSTFRKKGIYLGKTGGFSQYWEKGFPKYGRFQVMAICLGFSYICPFFTPAESVPPVPMKQLLDTAAPTACHSGSIFRRQPAPNASFQLHRIQSAPSRFYWRESCCYFYSTPVPQQPTPPFLSYAGEQDNICIAHRPKLRRIASPTSWFPVVPEAESSEYT